MSLIRLLLTLALCCGRAEGDGTCPATPALLNGSSFHGDMRVLANISTTAECCNASVVDVAILRINC